MAAETVDVNSKEQLDSLIKASPIAIVNFKSSSARDEQISTYYKAASKNLAHPDAVAFLSVDTDSHKDLADEYSITSFPTFLIFRTGELKDTVLIENPSELTKLIQKVALHLRALGGADTDAGPSSHSAGGDSNWSGAELPRGYGDVSEQVEIKGCELLNADDDAGPVKVLFGNSKPSALSGGSPATKDWVQSGSDDQLLLFIPFQSTVKLHTLQITSFPEKDQTDVSRPGVIHLYINRPQNMDFSEADDTEPTQAITLGPKDWNANGTANISLRYVKFQKTSSLIVYVQQGDGEADAVRLDRIKLIGEAGAKREMGKLNKVGDEE